jgi:hypothetical protein
MAAWCMQTYEAASWCHVVLSSRLIYCSNWLLLDRIETSCHDAFLHNSLALFAAEVDVVDSRAVEWLPCCAECCSIGAGRALHGMLCFS